jgi:hypothetical protein
MTTPNEDASARLDDLLTESMARWDLWHALHSEPTDADRYVDVVGALIETLLPTSDSTLQHLAADPRVWAHSYGDDDNSVRGSVQAALTSLIVDHLEASAGERGASD